jgi:hypothetical protein
MKKSRQVPPLVKALAPPPLTVDVDLDTPRKNEEPVEEESFFDALTRRMRHLFTSDAGQTKEEEGKAASVESEETELERLRKERACLVCSVARRNTVLRSCSHVAMCGECARKRKKCPICLEDYLWTSVQEIFFE